IPGGTFAMGARPSTKGELAGKDSLDDLAQNDERPVRQMTLAPFFLSKFEMTQAQWLRITGENPSRYAVGSVQGEHTTSPLHPVEQVSWELCARELEHLGLVLPTEAQWEYAARAGTTSPWWTGSRVMTLAGAANISDRAAQRDGANWPAAREPPDLDDGYVV